MALDVWLLVVVLWFYFHLMSVSRSTDELAAVLPQRVITFGIIMRAVICVTPLIAWRRGLPLATNVFACSFALTTLIGPLLLPTHEPGAADSRSFPVFAFF